jgi:hypothetical protein
LEDELSEQPVAAAQIIDSAKIAVIIFFIIFPPSLFYQLKSTN